MKEFERREKTMLALELYISALTVKENKNVSPGS